jgi:predicted RNase H-like nuclease (RuvC/YqgF family)
MTIATLKAAIEAKKLEVSEKQQEVEAFEYEATESEYDEFLDCEGAVSVGGMEFYPSDIIKNCDPVAYRCGKSDYESNIDLNGVEEYRDLYSELEDLESELEDLESELEEAEEQAENNEENN